MKNNGQDFWQVSSGVTQHWYHWKYVDVKHLFKFKWNLCCAESKPECAPLIHDGMNMWLLRIIKLDLFSCAIPELQCLCNNSTTWMLAWEEKFSLCLEQRRKDPCLLYTWAIWHVMLTSNIQYCSDLQDHKRQQTQMNFQLFFCQKQEMPAVGISLNSPLRIAATEWWGIQEQALSNEDFNWHTAERDLKPTCICQNGSADLSVVFVIQDKL